MGNKWKSSGSRGVRFYEHPSRKNGVRRDRYFAIRFMVSGKQIEEGLGWASQGWTEKKAALVRAELLEAQRRGEGPRTLKEKRTLQKQTEELRLAEGLTLSEFWESDYIHTLKARVKTTSWEKEEMHYRKRISPIMGHKALKAITTVDVDTLLDRMREVGLAPRTQEYAVGTLHRIWKHAARRKLVKAGDNPAIGVSIKKTNNTRLRVLTPLELQQILEYLSILDRAAHDITLFCAFTGCRFSEAAHLTWEHVNLDRATAQFVDTKNKETRTVFLVDEILAVLDRIGTGGTGEHVFKMKDGGPYRYTPKPFKTAVKHLGLNEGRGPRDRAMFHTLRHTAATHAARRGVPVKDMQIAFGWKTPSMVFRYAKGDEDTQRRAMQGVAQSLKAEQAKVIPMKGGRHE
ncbi:MAG: tyrosine-type recombinase/integrase [Thermodesulfobacteriota bacterium]